MIFCKHRCHMCVNLTIFKFIYLRKIALLVNWREQLGRVISDDSLSLFANHVYFACRLREQTRFFWNISSSLTSANTPSNPLKPSLALFVANGSATMNKGLMIKWVMNHRITGIYPLSGKFTLSYVYTV